MKLMMITKNDFEYKDYSDENCDNEIQDLIQGRCWTEETWRTATGILPFLF